MQPVRTSISEGKTCFRQRSLQNSLQGKSRFSNILILKIKALRCLTLYPPVKISPLKVKGWKRLDILPFPLWCNADWKRFIATYFSLLFVSLFFHLSSNGRFETCLLCLGCGSREVKYKRFLLSVDVASF